MVEFFDTNVLVYCTDTATPAKQALARALVARSSAAGSAVPSTRVLIELFHTLQRKQRMPPAAAQVLTEAYAGWRVPWSTLRQRHRRQSLRDQRPPKVERGRYARVSRVTAETD